MKVFALVFLAIFAVFEISSAQLVEWTISGGHGIATPSPPCPNPFEGLNQEQIDKMDEVYSKMKERGLLKRPECLGQAYLQNERNI